MADSFRRGDALQGGCLASTWCRAASHFHTAQASQKCASHWQLFQAGGGQMQRVIQGCPSKACALDASIFSFFSAYLLIVYSIQMQALSDVHLLLDIGLTM